MCRLRNIALESVTDGQTDGRTDRWRTKWSLCVAMLRRRHKNLFKKMTGTAGGVGAPLPSHATVHCIPTNIENPKAGIITTFSEFACFAFSFYFFRRSEQNGNYFHLCAQMLVVQTALNLPNNVRRNGHYGYTIMRHISQKLKLEEGRMFKYSTNSPSPAEKVLIARILERKDWDFFILRPERSAGDI